MWTLDLLQQVVEPRNSSLPEVELISWTRVVELTPYLIRLRHQLQRTYLVDDFDNLQSLGSADNLNEENKSTKCKFEKQ